MTADSPSALSYDPVGADELPPRPAQSRAARSRPPRHGARSSSSPARAPARRASSLTGWRAWSQAGADPRTIVAVTFTNKAAGEMRERRAGPRSAGAALAPSSARSTPGACGCCAAAPAEASLPPRFSIADSGDQLALVKEAMEELGISDHVLPPERRARRASRTAKNALVIRRAVPRRADGLRGRTDRAGLRPLREEARLDRRSRLRRPHRAVRAPAVGRRARSRPRSGGACGTS